MEKNFENISKIIQKDPGQRGISKLIDERTSSDLYNACLQIHEAKSVCIITGIVNSLISRIFLSRN